MAKYLLCPIAILPEFSTFVWYSFSGAGHHILKDIEITVDADYIAQVKENLGGSRATRFIDYTRIKEMAQQAREHRLITEYTDNFFKKAFIKD